jgi:hypothetical protein
MEWWFLWFKRTRKKEPKKQGKFQRKLQGLWNKLKLKNKRPKEIVISTS